ncbi:MAG: MFS transporter, partial [Bacillota bacterium]|nr:MFS transporter [Bacillota bacterium]
QPLGVFLITEKLGLPKEDLQWLMAAFGIGMILGGAVIVGFSRKLAPQTLLSIGLAASAIGFIGMGVSDSFWLTLASQFFSGLFMPCIHIGINTMILQNTEEAFIGRVNGILNPLFMGAMVVTMTASGWLKTQLSLEYLYEASALLLVVGIVTLMPLIAKRNKELQQEG